MSKDCFGFGYGRLSKQIDCTYKRSVCQDSCAHPTDLELVAQQHLPIFSVGYSIINQQRNQRLVEISKSNTNHTTNRMWKNIFLTLVQNLSQLPRIHLEISTTIMTNLVLPCDVVRSTVQIIVVSDRIESRDVN